MIAFRASVMTGKTRKRWASFASRVLIALPAGQETSPHGKFRLTDAKVGYSEISDLLL